MARCKWCGAQVLPYCACSQKDHCSQACHEADEGGAPQNEEPLPFEEAAEDLGPERSALACPHCEFVAKSAFGLQGHVRARHGS